jgi:PIN domain nuclease of toxin-antitoxin system
LNALLLDTHTLLWSLGDVDRLSPVVRDVLAEGATTAYVSAASIWEIAIKRRSGKLKAPDDLAQKIAQASYDELAISHRHAELAGALPLHHQDPFDRMIVAQARCEGFTIVTRDRRISSYGVPVLW